VSKQTSGNTEGLIGIHMWRNYCVKTVVTSDSYYRMSLQDFDALVQFLGDEVVPNVAMFSLRC
jgi:hypothetical protein